MIKRLDRNELLALVKSISTANDLTTAEVNERVLLFAINSPDPAKAMDLLLEPGGPSTAEEIVNTALAFPPRDPRSLSFAELHPEHPLRALRVEDQPR